MMRTMRAILCAVALLGGAALRAPAQDNPSSSQELAKLRFESLQAAMQRLQVALEQTSPDESKLLNAGNRFVQEARIPEQMAAIRGMLRMGRWDEAIEGMQAVRTELDELMSLLLDRTPDSERSLAEIKRLEEYAKRLQELLDAQRAEKEAAARTAELQQQLAEAERTKAEIDGLAARQRELRATTAGEAADPERTRPLEAKEKELAEAARALAERARALPSAERREDQNEQNEQSTGSGGSCAGSCDAAASAMDRAAQKLGANQPQPSLEDMDRALAELDAASRALERAAEEARRELLAQPFDQQTKAQEQTRVDTDRLAADMEKPAQSEKGEAPAQATPGTAQVQQAVPKQKAAAGQLSEERPSDAKQSQQDAIENLEAAQKELEEALAQLRQEMQDEVMRALEERFARMLAAQRDLTAKTVVTERLRTESVAANGALPAALIQRCGELADGEGGLLSEAQEARKLLEDEGTTAVFPEIVAELERDLAGIARALRAQQTGATTQATQAQVEETLRLLLDSLRRARSSEQNPAQAGQCDGQPPLVPASAEFKLILALQKIVNSRTKDYDARVPETTRSTADATDEAAEISRKQGRVEELTRKLATKASKESEAQPR